jgi:hypothetical protein
LSFDDFLPKQTGEVFELRQHQKDALDSLAKMRADQKTIALLTHAQGAGKTVVAISDAKRLGGRTLFVAHRRELVTQAYDKLRELWPEATAGLFMGDVRDCEAHNIAGSIQSISDHLEDFPPPAFQYLVIDEAHHAAAPTYKRVLGYFRPQFGMQQLGRGTRKAPGKECLVVIDFVDNASKYNQSLNLHRAIGAPAYRPGGLLLAPDNLKRTEEDAIDRGERPTAVIEIGLWAKGYQEIDVFNWQEAVANMISVSELEVELAASEGVVRRAIEREEVRPDHTVTLGDRVYYYFSRERVDEIREALGLPKVEHHNIKDLFLRYADDKMDMSASYKPVMLLAILDSVDSHGRASLAEIVRKFRQFYEDRKAAGLVVEKATARMAKLDGLDDSDV